MPEVAAYAIDSPTGRYARTTITRREPGPTEVFFDIAYAGICHSDIHTARGEWGPVNYPLVPGHEIAGVVAQIGSEVTKFKVGDRVGVGCFVDSCGECDMCRQGEEQFCTSRPGTVWTYASTGRDGLPTTHLRASPADRSRNRARPRPAQPMKERARRCALID